MRTAKVLVLLASYNGDEFLEEQLNSILNQNSVATDIIIFDDGSKDSTISVIERVISKFPNRITLLHNDEPIHNPLHSFSFLTEYVKEKKMVMNYDFISFSDQDDIWLPNKIKNSVDLILETDAKVSISSGISTNLVNKANITTYDKRVYTFGEALLKNNAIGMTMVFASDFFESIIFPENINLKIWLHDHVMYLIALYQGVKIVFVREAGVIYRQHSRNVIGDTKANLITQLKSKIKYVNNSQSDRKKIANFLRNNYIGTHENQKLLDDYIEYEKKSIFVRLSIVHPRKIFAEKHNVYIVTKLLAILKKL
ncbi:glycosyltransferase [Leuconostoc suionicum]|uniref:glycosyltransferase n=1 Tax=Leuconostoc suionicum TaxID=1511761 RepID=UPI0024AC8CC7|nr:glycosyltransferase [Leuconostoc suionicum]MDI6544828.1 glycosyltransferase [Leuconostoc suionicum]